MTEKPDESFIEHAEEVATETGQELVADTKVLASAIGGWRGAIDSGLPSLAFLFVYFADDRNLKLALTVAIGVSILLAIIAVLNKQSIQQVLSGLFGVGISAWITAKTGNAQNFFLPGIIRNGVYGLICLISIAVKRPLLGYALFYLRKTTSEQTENGAEVAAPTSWRDDVTLSRKYSTVTWIWALLFLVRFVVMFPMWIAGATGALGIASVVLGYPLFALAIYGSYLVLRDAKPTGE